MYPWEVPKFWWWSRKLQSDRLSIRSRAIAHIAEIGGDDAIFAIAPLVANDRDQNVRATAVKFLADLGAKDMITPALKDKERGVRQKAALGLARLGDVRCVPILLGRIRYERGFWTSDSYAAWSRSAAAKELQLTEARNALIMYLNTPSAQCPANLLLQLEKVADWVARYSGRAQNTNPLSSSRPVVSTRQCSFERLRDLARRRLGPPGDLPARRPGLYRLPAHSRAAQVSGTAEDDLRAGRTSQIPDLLPL